MGSSIALGMDIRDHKAWIKHIAAAPKNMTLCATLWWVWRTRNDEVMANKVSSVDRIARDISYEVEVFCMDPLQVANLSRIPRWVRWEWPIDGVVKLNVDGCSKGNPGLAGFGGLVCNDHGRWVFGFEGLLRFADNLLPELVAICTRLKLAWEHGYRVISCESDSTEVLQLIQHAEESHLYGTIIAEIRDWLQRDWTVSISHVLREANACADFLANVGVAGNAKLQILQEPPAGLLHLLREDFQGTMFLRY